MPCNCIGKKMHKGKAPIPPKPPVITSSTKEKPKVHRIRYIYSSSTVSQVGEHPEKKFRESH